MKTMICALASTVMFALGGTAVAQAADYPTKPIRLVVPYGPGGSSDTIMRPVAMALEKQLGQQVVIVNRAGGGGTVGWLHAAKAKPDGYTITMLTNAMIVKDAIGMASVTVKDFTPIANIGFVDLTVSAKDGGPYQTLTAFADAAKKAPDTVTLAMGVGTPAQFVAKQVDIALDDTIKPINVGGGADKKTAVLGGHVNALIEPISSVIGAHRSKQLHILAVLSDKRLAFAPDIPTAKEQGVDVEARLFYGLGAAKGTPNAVIEKLVAATAALADDAEFQDKLKNLSFSWGYSAGPAYEKVIDHAIVTTNKIAAQLK